MCSDEKETIKKRIDYTRKYNVATVLRRDKITYAHTPAEVLSSLGSKAISYKRLPEIFAAAMGNDTFILRHQELDPLLDAVSFSLEKVGKET